MRIERSQTVSACPFEQWIISDEASQFSGNHIAFLNGEGVIACSPSLDALTASVAKHPSRREVILDFVPSDDRTSKAKLDALEDDSRRLNAIREALEAYQKAVSELGAGAELTRLRFKFIASVSRILDL